MTAVRAVPAIPFTIDWEDWFQLCLDPWDAPGALDRHPCRLERATELCLELCEELGGRATWFCLADQARRHPSLLKRVAEAGHEIALHGLEHRRAFCFDAAGFARWVREGRAALEDLTGGPVLGFRAPEWSFRGPAEDHWRELPALGFRYDSSRAPLALLGAPGRPREPHQLLPGFWEFPPPVWGPRGLALPLWGWGLRTLPEVLLRHRLLSQARRGRGTLLVLHPWELDEGPHPLPGAPLGHRLAHGLGLRGYGARLRRLLRGLEPRSLAQWVDAMEWQEEGAGTGGQRSAGRAALSAGGAPPSAGTVSMSARLTARPAAMDGGPAPGGWRREHM